MLGIILVSFLFTTFKLLTLPMQTPLMIGYLAWLIWLAFEAYRKQTELYGYSLRDFILRKRPKDEIVNC